jgi:hypothetical protein
MTTTPQPKKPVASKNKAERLFIATTPIEYIQAGERLMQAQQKPAEKKPK